MNDNQQNDDGLDWLASQFVLGELGADAEQAFRDRLAADPQAVEAVARAIETMELVCRSFQPRQSAAIPDPAMEGARGVALPAGEERESVRPGRAGDRRQWKFLDVRPGWLVAASLLLAVAGGLHWGRLWMEGMQEERMLAAAWAERASMEPPGSDWPEEDNWLASADDPDRFAWDREEERESDEPGEWVLAAALAAGDLLEEEDSGG